MAPAAANSAMCEVTDLTVAYQSGDEWLRAVRSVSFEVRRGEILAVVGETGSGKSTTATAVIRMLPANGKVVSGRVMFDGRDLVHLPSQEMRRLRGQDIAYVPQQPMSAFNPTMTVGRQVAEPLLIHRRANASDAAREASKRLKEMGIREVDRVMKAYPHQLSGGMLQRAMIATAMICQPRLLILDEPTSALDVTIQRQILALIKQVQSEYRLAVILISHDLTVVSQVADRILVMYGGRAVEIGATEAIMNRARHPYTRGLLRSTMAGEREHKAKLASLAGYPPAPHDVDSEQGCPFRPRCPRAVDQCSTMFPPFSAGGADSWACFNPEPVE
ncbi:MAG TPA: ABC transporter ATP-binding protein [Candidatus Dormibacteraeota bacterium]|nr:ABC transporter ATP-binding protein [Candidatus Dormibacteraeota bacterium]